MLITFLILTRTYSSFSDIVNCDLKSTLRVLYNLFTRYRNVDWAHKHRGTLDYILTLPLLPSCFMSLFFLSEYYVLFHCDNVAYKAFFLKGLVCEILCHLAVKVEAPPPPSGKDANICMYSPTSLDHRVHEESTDCSQSRSHDTSVHHQPLKIPLWSKSHMRCFLSYSLLPSSAVVNILCWWCTRGSCFHDCDYGRQEFPSGFHRDPASTSGSFLLLALILLRLSR